MCRNGVQQVCEGFGSVRRAKDEGEMDEDGGVLDVMISVVGRKG